MNKGYFVLSQQRFKGTVFSIRITFFYSKKLYIYQIIYIYVYLINKTRSNYLPKENKVTGRILLLLT